MPKNSKKKKHWLMMMMMMMMNSALSHTLTICNCTPATEKKFELPLGTSNG
jgi:hypothetical protein